jgi:hypothetical protein
MMALMGCGEELVKCAEEKAAKVKAVAGEAKAAADWKVIEKAIREELEKPTGELTKADLEKVTRLDLGRNQLTDVKGLERLTQLKNLWLKDNPDLTKAQIAELQKALPKCKIEHNAKE